MSVDISDRMFAKFVGRALRQAREARGWTRQQLVERLPCGIGDRTLLSYEHGIRFLSVVRFGEICRALGVPGSEILRRAEDAAKDLTQRTLTVNLRTVSKAGDAPSGVAEWAWRRVLAGDGPFLRLEPATLREMAATLDLTHDELAAYLAAHSVDEERGEVNQ